MAPAQTSAEAKAMQFRRVRITDIVSPQLPKDFTGSRREPSARGNYWQSFASMIRLRPCQFAATRIRYYKMARTRASNGQGK
jgi:hypothetical protein